MFSYKIIEISCEICSNIYSDIKPDFGLTGVYSYFYSSYYFS